MGYVFLVLYYYLYRFVRKLKGYKLNMEIVLIGKLCLKVFFNIIFVLYFFIVRLLFFLNLFIFGSVYFINMVLWFIG